MKSIRFLPPAEIELREAAGYYEQQRSGVGRHLLASVEALAKRLTTFPALGHAVKGGFRALPVPGFPHELVYQERVDELLIVALAHAKRRPGYWRERLR